MSSKKWTIEFKSEALRMVRDSGLPVREIAKDLGVGYSTLTKWKSKADEAELMAGPHEDVDKELARLRRENRILREERDIIKNNPGLCPPVRGRNEPCYYGCLEGSGR